MAKLFTCEACQTKVEHEELGLITDTFVLCEDCADDPEQLGAVAYSDRRISHDENEY